MRTLLIKTWRDVKARKAQFLALIILVALGISSYVGFISSSKNLSASLDRANNELKLADFNIQVVMSAKKVAADLAGIDGVKKVQGRQVIDTGLEYGKNGQAQARVIGVPAGKRPAVDDVLVLKGRYLAKDAQDEVLLQNIFADAVGKKVGDPLLLQADGRRVKLKIVGIVSTPEYFMHRRSKVDFASPKEFAVLFINQEQVEGLFGRGPTYNDYIFLTDKGADEADIIKAAEKKLEPYRIIATIEKKDQASNFGMREEIRQNQEIGNFMPLIILFISALTLAIALSRMVQSQRGEIGLSKALGYRNWQILTHYLLFSLIIAIAGSVLGFIFGQIFAVWETGLYVDILNIPILESKIYPDVVANAVILSVISCVLAGIFPALRSSRMLPAVAMRFDPSVAVSKGRISLLERIFGRILPKTFTVRLPLRDVTRARRRSAYTVIGIAFALILTVATWSMFDSMSSMLDYVFNRSMNYDIIGVFRKEFSADMLTKIRDLDGVDKAQAALIVPAKLTFKGAEHEGTITTAEAGANFTEFDIISGDSAKEVFAGDGLMLSETTAAKLKADIGDMITVKTPYLKKTIKLKVKSINKELWGMNAYAGIEQGAKLKGLSAKSYNAVYINADNGNAIEIKKEIFALPGAAMVSVKQDLKDMINDMLGFMWVFIIILFGFSFTMAFIVIYNTFTANVIERTREIATMMTIGEDRWHLAAMITLENVLLAVLGIPLGLYLGVLTTQYMFTSLSTEAYTLDAIIYPMSYVWIMLMIIVVLLISEIPPIRRIFKLDLAESTKTLD
jgi:putative ABC transport system permease protein